MRHFRKSIILDALFLGMVLCSLILTLIIHINHSLPSGKVFFFLYATIILSSLFHFFLHKIVTIIENLDGYLLIAFGLVAFFFPLIDLAAHFLEKEKSTEIITHVILCFVGIIIGYSGYERHRVKSEIIKKLAQLKTFEIFRGTEEIFQEAQRAIKKAKKEIRATNLIYNSQDLEKYDLPAQHYFKTVLNRANQDVSYYTVLNSNQGIDHRHWTEEEIKKISSRLHLYDVASSNKAIDPILANLFFDFIIVDNKMAFIVLPRATENGLETMLLVDGNSNHGKEFIDRLIDWYDKCLLVYFEDGLVKEKDLVPFFKNSGKKS